ncbi:hypothetical protein L484_015258 [Morus notabilis]|uniref:Uncharacterized protein n=1 Tax=Morus notabilis TaxID=981085 RepID=W9RUV9_9ROSA|nr:hypothetical protein L484_015258 [Morus notabilis]
MTGVLKEKLRYFLNLHHLHMQNEEPGLMEQSKASNSISISLAREDLQSRSCVVVLQTCRRRTSNNSRCNMRSKRGEIVVVPTTVNCLYNSIHSGFLAIFIITSNDLHDCDIANENLHLDVSW